MDFLKNAKDMVQNPALYAEMVVDRLRNFNRGEKPVANAAGAGMVPMTTEERAQQFTQGALDNIGGGGMGAVGSVTGQKEIINLLRSGKLPGNSAVRYEIAGRPLFDEGVVHYDASGGKQASDIMRFPMMEDGDLMSKAKVAKYKKEAQFRLGDLSNIPEESVIYTPHDRWMGARFREGLLPPGKHEFYINYGEGNIPTLDQFAAIRGAPDPKVRDILNDPDLRKAYNLSLAAPVNSPFHQFAKILRDR